MTTEDGVTREVYSVFFKDLFLLKSAGLEASVPITLNSKKAESSGSIMITNSFINNNFFPVCLAKATFEYLSTLWTMYTPTYSRILQIFKHKR